MAESLCLQWQYNPASAFSTPGPSPLFTKDAALGVGWSTAMSDTSAIVTGLLRIMHPALYRAGCEAMAKLTAQQPHLSKILQRWGTPFTAITIISNRSTPAHRDTRSLKEYFDILTSVGQFSNAVMELDGVGIQVMVTPGTVIGLCGWVLRHAVKKCSGDRIFYGWYMRSAVHASQGIRPASWMPQETYRTFIGNFKECMGRNEYPLSEL